MSKVDNLKITMTVDGQQIYFGAPVFYSIKNGGDGETIIIQTEIGNTTKQRFEIQIKNHTYVEPVTLESVEREVPTTTDTKPTVE